ncbi:MAG: ATP-dependent helicase HrpB [Bacteroidales bacterium]|nr:ATP-dependent helicase HrpB [Bacteroidales bacterium]
MTIFNPHSFGLPAADIVGRLSDVLSKDGCVIVTAPPGAGKSTLLPLSLLETVGEGQKIIMLEPRRIAARQIAERMSEMIGETVGGTVGYRIRFDNKVSDKTRIEVVTEGILTRMLQSDNGLSGVGMVIFDEFHERSLFADVALALCRECQMVLREDLKIVIMSATIDTEELSRKLNACVIESQGRMYPVETVYTGDFDVANVSQQTAHVIREALKSSEGDVLAFLPGEGEIRRCEESLGGLSEDVRVCPLYGMLSQSQQHDAIMPDRNGRRKIVLATSIAETSLTIEGVRVVVDSGYCKQLSYDAMTSLSRLETVRISRDMADQRRGRAGRVAEGVCYRMWSRVTEGKMRENRQPEIEKADLTQLAMDMALWGESDVDNMTWLTPPSKASIAKAYDLLEMLGVTDEKRRVTDIGRKVGKIPCHPRIAKMMMEAETDEEKSVAADIAALMEERDPMGRETGVDINLRIEALRRYRAGNVNDRNIARIEQIAGQYRKMMRVSPASGVVDLYCTGRLIAAAYPERVAMAHNGSSATYRLANGQLAQMEHTDMLSGEEWLAIAHIDARETMGKIFLASPVDPKDLRNKARRIDNVSWDGRKGSVVAQQELRLGKIVLEAKPLSNVDRREIDKAILKAVEKEWLSMLDWNEEVERLQNRVLSLRKWHPEMAWPDVSTENLMADAEQWLGPYLGKSVSVQDLKKIDLTEAIRYTMDYAMQQDLDKLAPTHIEVASGSKIKVQYQSNGSAPVLAVRLQECFGMAETPTVDGGRIKVLMHLLSPGFKPVQITQDLRSFWDNAYFDVKKELKSRYPKHVWPDKPWEEEAVRGVKRKDIR